MRDARRRFAASACGQPHRGGNTSARKTLGRQDPDRESRRADVAPAPGSQLKRGIRLDSETVVDRASQSLFASKVALRRLDRDVPQEESNLIQFAALPPQMIWPSRSRCYPRGPAREG